jgi:hypothetical protein
MDIEDTSDTVTFDHSGECLQMSFAEFSDKIISSLDDYGVPSLMGRAFCDVIAIALQLRQDGSGREIPCFIIRTNLGEVDFGLTSRLLKENGKVWVRLLPFDGAYYRRMDPNFSWPAGLVVDAGGRPVAAVDGLKASGGFFITTLYRR